MPDQIRQEKIVGSRRFSNYFWALLLLIGGLIIAGGIMPGKVFNLFDR